MLAAVRQNGEALQFTQFKEDTEVVLAAVETNGMALEYASPELQNDAHTVLAAIRNNGVALKHASKRLRCDRNFVLDAVRATRASWLVKLAADNLSADEAFVQMCHEAAGNGLIFTYYHSYDCFQDMRRYLKTSGASIPGGKAYDLVIAKLREDQGSAATVWFDGIPVFGISADSGCWLHPSEECGRDNVEVPPKHDRHPMWNTMLESRISDLEPTVGSKHPCWCCHWLRAVKERHAEGYVICCTTSNIYQDDWVTKYNAGSSELSDARADQLRLGRENFKHGKPEGWGEGSIQISNGRTFLREAKVHPRTNLPLGVGCRWERRTLDGLGFPVYAFFMP